MTSAPSTARGRRLAVWALLAAGLVALGAALATAAMLRWGFAPHFQVTLQDGALTYTRQPCDAAAVTADFFLHVFPMNVADLHFDRRALGFDSVSFRFVGDPRDGACVVTRRLPNYPIKRIATGQFDDTGQHWVRRFDMPPAYQAIERNEPVFEPGNTVTLHTQLHRLDVSTVRLEPFATTGGAIERVGDSLLVASPHGRLAVISPAGQVIYLEGRVPMNQASPLADEQAYHKAVYRVMDILLWERDGGRHDLFVTHHFFGEDCVLFRLSVTTLTVVAGRMEVSPVWRTIFDAKPCMTLPHYSGKESGGRLLEDGPHHLLVTVGNHRAGTFRLPMPRDHPEQHLGKVLRVDLRSGAVAIHTSGHRTPQGLARDRHGDVWLTEHGPRHGDELNLIEPGRHYGWPYVSYGYRYHRLPLTPGDRRPGHHDGFVTPVLAWVPGIGVSAIIANDEAAFPAWDDDLLIASLWGHFHGQSLFRLRHRQRRALYVEKIELGEQIRDLAHAFDHHLALLLDDARVLMLRRSDT